MLFAIGSGALACLLVAWPYLTTVRRSHVVEWPDASYGSMERMNAWAHRQGPSIETLPLMREIVRVERVHRWKRDSVYGLPLRHGPCREYCDDLLIVAGQFHMDDPCGVWTFWDMRGEVIVQMDFENTRREPNSLHTNLGVGPEFFDKPTIVESPPWLPMPAK